MLTIKLEDIFDFLDSQLHLPQLTVSKNSIDHSTVQIDKLMQKKRHFNLNEIQLHIINSAPPHLLEITKEYLLSLSRALFRFGYEENFVGVNNEGEIEITMGHTNRSRLTSTFRTTEGFLKINQQQLQEHINYLREHDALFNSMFISEMPPKYNPWDISDFFKFIHLEGDFYRFPLIDSLVHHEIPSSIVYYKY